MLKIIAIFGGRKAFLTTCALVLGTIAWYFTKEKSFLHYGVFVAICLVSYGFLNVKTKDINIQNSSCEYKEK